MAGQYGEFVINLRRDTLNTAWGFRLQGGKEFNTYLSIQRVFNGSPADGHLQRGDVIVAVDNEDVSYWHQKQAYDLIQAIGLTLALVVRRGGSDADARPTPTSQQAQPVSSFVRQPFSQQQQQQAQSQHHQPQHQQHQQPPYALQQQLSPQLTSKATLNFQPAPSSQQQYAPSHPPSHFSTENIGPSSSGAVAPWAQQQQQQHSPVPHQNSFSTPFQVRSVQPPQKAYSSYSPQQGDSFASGKAAQPYAGSQYPQGTSSPAAYQQDQSGGRVPFAQDSYQRDAAQSSQQPSYNEESNHVTYDRNQSAAGSAGHDNRNEPVYNEGRKEGGGGGGEGEEEEDYQVLSVRDIKQMFNKPDQKDVRAGPVSRIKSSPVAWTRPLAESTSSPGAYGGASGPRLGQPPQSSLSPIRPGSVQRCPAVNDDFRKAYSPPARPNYGQTRFTSPPSLGKPTAVANVNKQGGAYGGIIQPSLPPKTTPPAGKPGQKGAPQKKKDFDPNQSAVYKILQEEEERAKNHPQQAEEEEEEAPRRQVQGPRQGPRKGPPQGQRQPQKQQQSGGSRLDELLERDAAQLAPYKEEERRQQEQREQQQRSAYQEQRAPHQEQRSLYQEPRAPHQEQRSPYQEPRAPYQEQRSPYQEPRAPYQEQRSPYQEPRAPTYQEAGSPQPYRNEVHQPRSPARGAPAVGGWQGTSSASGPYGSQDYASPFPQTQLVDGIPTSDF